MNNLINKKIHIQGLLPLIISIILFGIIYSEKEVFDYIVDIFCIIFIVCINILSLFKSGKNRESYYINIGCSSLIIAIIIMIRIILKAILENSQEAIDIISLIITYSINIFIIISLVISANFKKGKKIALFLGIVIIISIYSIISVKYWDKYIIINCSALVGLNMIQLEILWGKKEFKNELGYHIVYIILLLFFELSSLLSLVDYKKYLFISASCKYLFIYCLFIVIVEKFYYKLYYIEESNLKNIESTYKELNKILVKKNKELFELKKSIEKSEKRKRQLIEGMKDGIIMLTYNKVTYVNKVVTDLFRIHNNIDVREHIIGKTITEVSNEYRNKDIVYSDIQLPILDYYSSKTKVCRLYKVIDIDSKGEDYTVYFFKLNDSEGVLYCKDNTFVKRSNKLSSEYEKYLKEEKLKDEFYSNISHELRTPINIIYSAIQINSIHLEEKRKNKFLYNNSVIKQNCLRLIRTINNFIDTNKITEGYLKPNLLIHNIVSVVENISMACNRYIKKIDKTLIFDAEEEEIYAKIDKEMMERVIMNLLSNLVKYGESGGYVNINILNKDDIIIEVKHNLYTISEDIIPYIFDKFSRLNKSLNRKREGSGLGLFLSKALIELQGGTINLESNEREGTKFIITLPKLKDIDLNDVDNEEFKIEDVNNKVDTEFSDIYL